MIDPFRKYLRGMVVAVFLVRVFGGLRAGSRTSLLKFLRLNMIVGSEFCFRTFWAKLTTLFWFEWVSSSAVYIVRIRYLYYFFSRLIRSSRGKLGRCSAHRTHASGGRPNRTVRVSSPVPLADVVYEDRWGQSYRD